MAGDVTHKISLPGANRRLSRKCRGVQASSSQVLWERDLDVVVAELDRMDEEEEQMKKEEGRLRRVHLDHLEPCQGGQEEQTEGESENCLQGQDQGR